MYRLGRLSTVTLLCCAFTSAATIGPCNNCWLPFDPTQVVDGTAVPTNPYFANGSQDGANQSLAANLTQYLPLQYQSSGSAPPNDAPAGFYFNNPSGTALQAQFLQSTTADSLQLGWYNVQNPSQLNPLFTRSGSAFQGTVVPSGTVTFTPSTQFGFYVKYMNVGIPGNICSAILGGLAQSSLLSGTPTLLGAPAGSSCYDPAKVPLLSTNQVVYTQSNLNSTGTNTETSFEQGVAQIPSTLSSYHQHFVALQNPTTGAYYIGMEDAFGRDPSLDKFMGVYEGNGDYQDFVIALSPATPPPPPPPLNDMPEPASFALVGLGVAAMAGFRRLRRAK